MHLFIICSILDLKISDMDEWIDSDDDDDAESNDDGSDDGKEKNKKKKSTFLHFVD